MPKRPAVDGGSSKKRAPAEARPAHASDSDEEPVCEDAFEDVYEEEDIVPDTEQEGEETAAGEDALSGLTHGMNKLEIWDPKSAPLQPGEQLEYDETAYEMYYSYQTEWPCLSFDVVLDDLGLNRTKYPLSFFLVSGTQSSDPSGNSVIVQKVSELHKNHAADEDGEEEAGDSDSDDEPVFQSQCIPHDGEVNRIRSLRSQPQIVSTWSSSGKIHVWDISSSLLSISSVPNELHPLKPIYSFEGHSSEGFAMDWSRRKESLLTGDCKGNIFLHQARESTFETSKSAFRSGHASVEDLQWSPTEDQVFASCSVDRSISIWDTRKSSGCMLSVPAHDADVNVISWNRLESYLLLSGCDDGSFKVWDLRQFHPGSEVAHYKWYSDPITSVEWSPHDRSTLAASGEDGQLTIWDLSLERDDVADTDDDVDATIPPQLLFVHRGQTNTKELHFHEQIPNLVLSTAFDGFNLFKPNNAPESLEEDEQ